MTLEDLSVLRHYIDEQDKTIYGDQFLTDVIDRNGGDLNKAAAEVWGMKAARFSKLVGITESGSARRLSQKADGAKDMAAYYASRVVTAAAVQTAQTRTRPIVRTSQPRPTA